MSNKNIILGGGPTGIGIAIGLTDKSKNTQDITLIEKSSKLGGLAGSFKSGDDIIDYGPHRLAPTIKEIVKIAKESCGEDLLEKKSEHGVYINNKLYKFPPRISDWINFTSFFFLIRTSLSFTINLLNFFKKKNTNFENILINKFGKYFYKKIIEPMATKVWGNSKTLDPYFVKKRFSQLNPTEFLIKKLKNRQDLNPNNFFYPRYGFQQLWDNIYKKKLNTKIKFKFETYPLSINVNKDNYIDEIKFNNNNINLGDLSNHVISSTIPVSELIKTLTNFDKKVMEDNLRGLELRSMLLIFIKLNQPRTLPYRTIIFPQENVIFNRIFEQNLYSSETVEKGKSIIVADITFDFNKSEKEVDDMIKKAKDDLNKLNFIDKNKIVSINTKYIKYAYVSPTQNSQKAFVEIENELSKIKNLRLLGRFGVGEYDNSDYALESGINLSKFILNEVKSETYSEYRKKGKDNIIVG